METPSIPNQEMINLTDHERMALDHKTEMELALHKIEQDSGAELATAANPELEEVIIELNAPENLSDAEASIAKTELAETMQDIRELSGSKAARIIMLNMGVSPDLLEPPKPGDPGYPIDPFLLDLVMQSAIPG